MIPATKHFPADRDVLYSRIFLGIAWPAAWDGWSVVVGESRAERTAGGPIVTVLDEAADRRLYHVVENAAALRLYYKPERVFADAEHHAAMQFVERFAASGFRVEHSLLFAMRGPLGYALPLLERLLESRRLVIPASSGLNAQIKIPPRTQDLATLRLADYAGVAALAVAVLELEWSRDDGAALPRQGEMR